MLLRGCRKKIVPLLSFDYFFLVIQAFLDSNSVVYLNKELLNELLYSTAERITGRYYEMAADVVNLVS